MGRAANPGALPARTVTRFICRTWGRRGMSVLRDARGSHAESVRHRVELFQPPAPLLIYLRAGRLLKGCPAVCRKACWTDGCPGSRAVTLDVSGVVMCVTLAENVEEPLCASKCGMGERLKSYYS